MNTLVKATPELDLLDTEFRKVAEPAADWLYWSLRDDSFFGGYKSSLAQAFDVGMRLEIVAEFNKTMFNKTMSKAAWRAVPASRLGRTRAQLEGITPAQARILEVNEAAQAYAEITSGKLVAELTKQQHAAVQDLIARGVEQGWTDQHLARQLERVVGLDTRFSDAVYNFRKTLMDGGMRATEADRRADDYANSLLRSRTATIARTEMAKALNEGQRRMWLAALDDRAVPATVRSQWVLHPSERTCSYCRELAGNVSSPLAKGGTYRGGIDGPPLHPNCRCTERLVDQEHRLVKLDFDLILELLEKHAVHRQDDHGNWARGLPAPAAGKTNVHENDPKLDRLPATRRRRASDRFATRDEVLEIRRRQGEKALKCPPPTDWEIFTNAIDDQIRLLHHDKVGRNRGSGAKKDQINPLTGKTEKLSDRDVRELKLIGENDGGNGKAIDAITGQLMTRDQWQQDKIITNPLGGKYIMVNLVPTANHENVTRQDNDFAFGTPKWATPAFTKRARTYYRSIKDAVVRCQKENPNVRINRDIFIEWCTINGIRVPIESKRNPRTGKLTKGNLF